jgi:hypothetical protein
MHTCSPRLQARLRVIESAVSAAPAGVFSRGGMIHDGADKSGPFAPGMSFAGA